VSELRRRIRAPLEKTACAYDTPTDARAHIETYEVVYAASGAVKALTPCNRPHIVRDDCANPEETFQIFPKGHFPPAKVGRETHLPSLAIYLTGNADADAHRRGIRSLPQSTGHSRYIRFYGRRPSIHIGSHPQGIEDLSIPVYPGDLQLGAPQVHSQCPALSHPRTSSLPAFLASGSRKGRPAMIHATFYNLQLLCSSFKV
jgi:hypothetical protein